MKINTIDKTPQFKGLYNNKTLLFGLEKISDHSASFVAGVSFLSAIAMRPLAISLTPKADKENKKAISADSISSTLSKLLVTQSAALLVEGAVKKMDKTPERFLKKDTLQNLNNKDYKFLTQLIKLSTNLITAIPKSILGVALTPIILDVFLNKNKKEKEKEKSTLLPLQPNPVFNKVDKVNFKGITDKTATILGKISDLEGVQKFVKKHSINEKDIAKNTSILSDILLTSSSVFSIQRTNKIKKERKKPLVFNKIISTLISILVGDKIDKIIQNKGIRVIDKFKEVNRNNPKLSKCIEGINVLRPTLVFAFLYYGIIPIVSTFLSDKTHKD